MVSARTEDRLKAQVRQLLAALREADGQQPPLLPADDAQGEHGGPRRQPLRLCDVAYTLQLGREAMEWRLACVVEDLPQLCARFEAWLNGDKAVEDLYQGQARQNKEALGLFAGDELDETIGKWIERGKLRKLAELWAKGLSFDWGRLYGAGPAPPRRISLPSYPFAKERYWVEASAARPARGEGDGSAVAELNLRTVLHPLMHENISDLSGQRFRTRLSGEEFFLSDHVVRGHRILPGAAYLEMARAAIAKSAPWDGGLQLRNVVWPRHLPIGREVEMSG